MTQSIIKIPNGRKIQVSGRNFDLMDILLRRTYVRSKANWKVRILIRTTRQNIERYKHLWEG